MSYMPEYENLDINEMCCRHKFAYAADYLTMSDEVIFTLICKTGWKNPHIKIKNFMGWIYLNYWSCGTYPNKVEVLELILKNKRIVECLTAKDLVFICSIDMSEMTQDDVGCMLNILSQHIDFGKINPMNSSYNIISVSVDNVIVVFKHMFKNSSKSHQEIHDIYLHLRGIYRYLPRFEQLRGLITNKSG